MPGVEVASKGQKTTSCRRQYSGIVVFVGGGVQPRRRYLKLSVAGWSCQRRSCGGSQYDDATKLASADATNCPQKWTAFSYSKSESKDIVFSFLWNKSHIGCSVNGTNRNNLL